MLVPVHVTDSIRPMDEGPPSPPAAAGPEPVVAAEGMAAAGGRHRHRRARGLSVRRWFAGAAEPPGLQ